LYARQVLQCRLPEESLAEGKSGFVGRLRAMQHLRIGASAGDYLAMHCMQKAFERGLISRDEIDSILTAYNNSCAEMRSEAVVGGWREE
jgi:hypothetical protein